MNIKDIKKGMKVKSKNNSLVDYYIIEKVLKSVVWVSVPDIDFIYKNIKPSILEVV